LELICVPAFWISIVDVPDSGAIYLSVNTATDCGRSCSGFPDEDTVDTMSLNTGIYNQLKYIQLLIVTTKKVQAENYNYPVLYPEFSLPKYT